MLTMTHDLFRKFQDLVYEKSDLHFSPAKFVFFERQLRETLRAEGLDDYAALYERLLEDPEKLHGLVQDLTTNKTFFFRNRAQFDALRDVVFPEIIEAANMEVVRSWGRPQPAAPGGRHEAMRIRVWSCGCSTGEEAYSIAFTLLDVLRYPRAWEIEILGTDIKREALDAARRGIYDEESVKEADPAVVSRYMEKIGGDGAAWEVREQPARLVSFYEANLKELSGPFRGRLTLKSDGCPMPVDYNGYFDVIFCRNVMIYFDREGQQRLVDALWDCLRPGGCLFTGDSEPLHLFRHGFELVSHGDALYYRKPKQTGDEKWK